MREAASTLSRRPDASPAAPQSGLASADAAAQAAAGTPAAGQPSRPAASTARTAGSGGGDGSVAPEAMAPPPGRELWDPSRGVVASDVDQGNTGDCWLMAELEGLAATNPQALENMITPSADGRAATVTLHRNDGSLAQEQVAVPAAGRGDNAPGVYQAAPDALQPTGQDGRAHTWASVVEQAVHQYLGRHPDPKDPNHVATNDGLSGGGSAYASQLLTGQQGQYLDVGAQGGEAVWDALRSAPRGATVAASTQPATPAAPRLASGVEGGHVYGVLGTTVDARGQRYVYARDPKGARSESTADPGITDLPDGLKRFTLDAFARTFRVVHGVVLPRPGAAA